MKKILITALALLASTLVSAETFNRFGASTGVLKGSATSYQTTPAVSADIVSLWGGTCNSSSFLRGDGSCASVAGSGTVTSVGLTVPTGLSVTGSPITTSGTLGITTTLNGLLRGTGSGFATAANSDVIGLWTGTCNSTSFLRGDGSCASALSGTVPVGNGGTGATTLTGVLKGNGTSAFTAAAASDVISLWSGTCSSSSFLRGDGSCASTGAGTVTSVGLTMPTGFSVASSPVTSSGTLLVSTTLNGVLRGTGSGFATATASNIIPLWSGTCSSGTFLRGDGACAATTGAPGGSTTQVQFNNVGTFGGDAGFTYNSSTDVLTVAGGLEVGASGSIQINNVDVCLQNGTNCPIRQAFGTFSVSGGSCSPLGGYPNNGISSCVREDLGIFSITIPGTTNASCTAAAVGGPPAAVVFGFDTSGGILFEARGADSGTLVDTSFTIICMY